MLKLIVVSGLPGTGKSTISEGIARRLYIPIFSIDPIEAAMWRSGISYDATGVASYVIAATEADEQLKLGLSVVVDAVNPVEAARETWRTLARDRNVELICIEVICSDEVLHKRRIEHRVRNIGGMPEITWDRVLERKQEYEPWTDERLVLDSTENRDVLMQKALDYVNRPG